MPGREGSACYPCRDGVADLRRTPGGAVASFSEVGYHGVLDLAGGVLEAEVVEQQGHGQDRRRRVGLLLARDVGSGPVPGSNMLGVVRSGLTLPLAARPMPAVTAAARSVAV